MSSTFSCLLAITLQKCLFKYFAPLLKSDCLTDLKRFFMVSPILQRSFPLRVSSTAKSFHFHVVQFTYFFFLVIFALGITSKKTWVKIQGHENLLLFFIVRL